MLEPVCRHCSNCLLLGDTLQYLSEGGAIQSLIFVLREGVPEFQASACRALAGLVSDSHDRTFQFLIGEGLPPLLNLIGADKPGQLHSLALLARLLPCASKDAAERIAANPDLLALFKEVCTANVRGVPIAVASMAVVVLRVLAKVGRYATSTCHASPIIMRADYFYEAACNKPLSMRLLH
jgi:hypothetical protein